nr:NAD(P)H-binding protein [Campylobacter sp. MIT 12-5580]
MDKLSRRKFLQKSLAGLAVITAGAIPAFTQTHKKGEKMKTIAVLAASGRSGRLIVEEALKRGYSVTAFVRSANKLEEKPNLKVVVKDIFALQKADLEGFDVIVDAFGEWKDLSLHKKHIDHLVPLLQNNKAKFLVVGGAGSLYLDQSHTTRVMDTPDFPDEFKGVANATAEVLGVLRGQKSFNWVYVCPAAVFDFEAPATNSYKIIGEVFETNAKGESKVSYKDYASAMLDIAENANLNQTRVGVIGL